MAPIYGVPQPGRSGVPVSAIVTVPTADTSGALACTVVATSAVTGALAVTAPLATAVVTTATVTAAATGTAPVAVTAAGTSAVTAGLTVRAALSTTVTAVSAVTASLGANPLVGTVTAVSAVTGTITVLRPLAGTVAAVSGFTHFVPPPLAAGGKFWLRDAHIAVAGYDVTTACDRVKVEFSREELEVTGFDEDQYRVYLPGSPSPTTVEIDFLADPQALPAALWMTLSAGGPVWVAVTPRGPVAGAGNPMWAGYALPLRFVPLRGQVGQAAAATVELRSTGPFDEYLVAP